MNNNTIWLLSGVLACISALGVMVGYVYERRLGVAIFWGVCAAILLSVVTFSEAPRALGVGHVSDKIEVFSERLDPKIPYELVSSTRDGASFVLLLREFGTSNFRYIRTDTTPPEIFILIDGKPVAIQK